VGILNFALGFRSLGTVCLAAAIFCQMRRMRKFAGGRTRKSSMIVATVALAVAAFAIVQGYSYGASQGWLGHDAQLKYALQSNGEGGILLGGRSDVVGAAEAIADSPLVGHGSWARDPKYQAMEDERRVSMGYKREGNVIETGLIPSHSYLLGAWVEAGFVGTALWAWALWLTVKAVMRASGTEPLFPFFVFTAFLLAWCIAFSPYGADERFRATYSIYAMVMLNQFAQTKFRRRSYVHGIHRHYLFQSSSVSRTGHPVYPRAKIG
jgi:O-antigen ligase